jgi:Fic family protein
VRQLNIRQLWFYAELKQGRRPGMADLMNFWATGEATAKRDLSDLARLGLIQYVGSRRSGYYSL